MNKRICRPRAPGCCKLLQLCGLPAPLLWGRLQRLLLHTKAGGQGRLPSSRPRRRATAGLSRSPPQDGAPTGHVSLLLSRGALCLPQSRLCAGGCHRPWSREGRAANRRQPPPPLVPPRPHSPLPARPPHGSQALSLRACSAHRLRPHSLARPAREAPAALPVAAPQRGGRGWSL